ncbi:MAG: preprotein translocase subunit YajC [Candidatus Adiutrix sp.]|jgi:preprotein translocase subunit YajC|nr:preprotein translocase subunit YajC [Candidatus Adiutrix sp.]
MNILSLLANAAWAIDAENAGGASAAAGAAAAPNPIMSFMPLIVIFAIMYFLMIRPQQKRQKEHQAMLGALQKGDKVQTNGGLWGTVTGLEPADVTLEIAPQVRVKVGRGFIAKVSRPGDSAPASK